MMNAKMMSLTLAAALATTNASNAALLTFNTAGNTGLETFEPSTSNDAGVSASQLTLGTVSPASNANRFGGSNFFDTGDTNPTTLAESIAGNDYFQFIVSPTVGFQYNVTNLSFIFDRSSTGPSTVALRSSVDSFGANLGVATTPGSTSTFSNIAIAGLSNLTTATTFRLYGYGATAATGTGGFDTSATATVPNVVVDGTTALIVTTTPPVNVAPIVAVAPNTITVDVSPPGLEGFTGVTANAADLDGTLVSFLPGTIDPQIADNLTITATTPSSFSISGSNFTFADIGSYTINFTATDDGGASTIVPFTLNVVPEPTSLAALGLCGVMLRRRR